MNIILRSARPEDAQQIGQLIYDTVRIINRKDYTEEQVKAWAPDPMIFSTYTESYAYVAEVNGVIAGFGNLNSEGYLHRFYIHKDYQGLGVGSQLLGALESKAKELGLPQIRTEASITAKPFFLAKGWTEDLEQTVQFRGLSFINYKMSKKIL